MSIPPWPSVEEEGSNKKKFVAELSPESPTDVNRTDACVGLPYSTLYLGQDDTKTGKCMSH